MKIIISKHFQPLLADDHRYLVMCGGAGSGKSEFAGRKVFLRCMAEGRHRFLVMRKVRHTLNDSVVMLISRILEENGVAYEFNKTERRMNFNGPKGPAEILFAGMDDPEKIKSIKGITSIWLEEATEFMRAEFMQIDLRLREPGPGYHQIMLTFNPEEALAPWLKERFFDNIDPSAKVDVSTIDHNPIDSVRERYRAQLDELEEKDPTYWKIYRCGVWAALQGRIFTWPEEPLPAGGFDDIWYGGDFGYSVDPAALVKIYRKADTLWLEEKIYRNGMTNQDLSAEMLAKGIDLQTPSYWDAAEPKSIAELQDAGFNALPAAKGPDSVRAGLDLMRALDIRVVQGSQNLKAEAMQYHWRTDKQGNPMNEPVKYKDHLMSAARYGISTHMRAAPAFFETIEQDIRPD